MRAGQRIRSALLPGRGGDWFDRETDLGGRRAEPFSLLLEYASFGVPRCALSTSPGARAAGFPLLVREPPGGILAQQPSHKRFLEASEGRDRRTDGCDFEIRPFACRSRPRFIAASPK